MMSDGKSLEDLEGLDRWKGRLSFGNWNFQSPRPLYRISHREQRTESSREQSTISNEQWVEKVYKV